MDQPAKSSDTGAFVALKFPNLEVSWLDRVNEMVGLLKKHFSGQGRICTVWHGGREESTELTVKTDKKTRKLL